MANPVITPNMGLSEPQVGGTIPPTSPAWGYLLNSNWSTVDQHNHTPGYGVLIPTAGLNIDTNLNFQGNSAIDVNTFAFAAAVVGTPQTLSTYTNGTDLFFKDASGNLIQLTKAGGPNAGTGNIQGLPSTPTGGAGISWVNSTSTFQFLTDAGTTGANVDVGSAILRYPGSYPTPSGTNWITLEVPSAIAAGYAITLPAAVPASQSFVTMDNSGVVATPAVYPLPTAGIANNAVTRPKLAAVGQQVSSSSGTFSTNSTSFVDVTNLSATLTTTGRPVMLMLQPDASLSGNIQFGSQAANGSVAPLMAYQWVRDGVTSFGEVVVTCNPGAAQEFFIPPGSANCLDYGASAGTHTWKLEVKGFNIGGLSTALVQYCVLVAYEL
jgi:hypothetical protein